MSKKVTKTHQQVFEAKAKQLQDKAKKQLKATRLPVVAQTSPRIKVLTVINFVTSTIALGAATAAIIGGVIEKANKKSAPEAVHLSALDKEILRQAKERIAGNKVPANLQPKKDEPVKTNEQISLGDDAPAKKQNTKPVAGKVATPEKTDEKAVEVTAAVPQTAKPATIRKTTVQATPAKKPVAKKPTTTAAKVEPAE